MYKSNATFFPQPFHSLDFLIDGITLQQLSGSPPPAADVSTIAASTTFSATTAP